MGTNQRAQIVMSEAEITDFVTSSRTGTLATIGADGQPHLTAMWYGVVDGEIWLETKAKSQKAVNLKRDHVRAERQAVVTVMALLIGLDRIVALNVLALDLDNRTNHRVATGIFDDTLKT